MTVIESNSDIFSLYQLISLALGADSELQFRGSSLEVDKMLLQVSLLSFESGALRLYFIIFIFL